MNPLTKYFDEAIVEKEKEKECAKCDIIKPLYAFRIVCHEGEKKYRHECKECEKKIRSQLNSVKKEAYPRPKYCECCGTETDKLVYDHDHQTGKFRGYLCRKCNLAIGHIGDDIESLSRALNYLKGKKFNGGLIQRYNIFGFGYKKTRTGK